MFRSFVFIVTLIAASGCMPDVDDENVTQDTRPSRPDVHQDTWSPPPQDTYQPDTTPPPQPPGCIEGWYCANGGVCLDGECVVLEQDERLGIRCNAEVTLTLWGNRFEGDRLGDSFVQRANELYTGTTQVTAITVETSGTCLCECFDGGQYAGGAYNLPKGGWGCSK